MVSLNEEVLKDIDAYKVADLFQNLNNLVKKEREPQSGNKNDYEIDMIVPNRIKQILDEFEQAQNKFIQSIDLYLHRFTYRRRKSDLETDETIVKTCPDFLCSKHHGGLPIQCALGSKVEADFVPMLVKHGLKCNFGGKDCRGGLLAPHGNTKCITLQGIHYAKTLQILANSDPPLFYKQDILNYNLVPFAVFNTNMALAKWLIALCPSGLYRVNKEYSIGIPLHYCHFFSDPEMIKFCLEEAIKYDPSHPSIGGLFITDWENTFAIQKFKKDDGLFKAVAQVMSQHQQIPILHKIIEHTPELVDRFITFCPHVSIIRDENNRLPIHVALGWGMKTSIGLSAMLLANAQQLVEMDPVTKFCPGALAAMSPACDLDTIYNLIRAHPNHLEVGSRKHGRPSMPDSNAPHTRKRQKK